MKRWKYLSEEWNRQGGRGDDLGQEEEEHGEREQDGDREADLENKYCVMEIFYN